MDTMTADRKIEEAYMRDMQTPPDDHRLVCSHCGYVCLAWAYASLWWDGRGFICPKCKTLNEMTREEVSDDRRKE